MFGNTPLAQIGVNPLNVAAPQQPLVPQNEVLVVVPDEVVKNDNGMNFMKKRIRMKILVFIRRKENFAQTTISRRMTT
ncbi:unnamed protein product [Trifolium pratense]|uniref:Uncharacterized protein n=1 Tax=Trifolium pratense TaxID=57577 RepID=A0ACB0KCW1_TRIPR|nr:unnamed protein product [Trifolium pratense]